MDDGRRAALIAPAIPDDDAPTRDFGPRPPWRVDSRTPAVRRPRRWARRPPLLAAAAGLIVAVAVGATTAIGAPTHDCRRRTIPARLPGAAILHGDVDGDGCADAVLYRAGVLVVAAGVLEPSVVRFHLDGHERVVLGDWDCDGIDTPAEYDPKTGVVTYFDAWPLTPAPIVPSGNAIARRGGTPAVARVPGRCDRVIVT